MFNVIVNDILGPDVTEKGLSPDKNIIDTNPVRDRPSFTVFYSVVRSLPFELLCGTIAPGHIRVIPM
jgi:hypothetical protein